MLSPALQHFEQASSTVVHAPEFDKEANLTAFNRSYRIKLAADLKRLKAIKSQSRRQQVKAEVLSEYQPYLDHVLNRVAVHRSQDNVLVWCILWAIDIGKLEMALPLIEIAFKHTMQAPEGFSRSLVEVVSEEVTKLALAHHPSDYLPVIQTLWAWVQHHDMSDIIKARLLKAYGLALASADAKQALALLEQAQALNKSIGVKSHIKRLQAGLVMPVTAKTVKRFNVSTRKAADLVGVSIPTFLKYAALNPENLPYLCLEAGKKKMFRFCESDVLAFKNKHTHGSKVA